MARWDDYDRWRFPPSVPRPATGGIKAQSKRGAFGEKWWARRWIEVLESFQIGARLQRGRSYARRGQVLGIEVEKGRVEAQVQGSRPKPYTVTIAMKTLPPKAWKSIARELESQAIFAAKLLAGEMPPEIEGVFRQAGYSLFPEMLRDIETDCSCPDWSNPCKHIAAVYYLLGEEFDRDPFLVLKLRGRTREELLEGMESAAGGTEAESAPEPLPEDPAAFWQAPELPEDLFGEVAAPPSPAALVKRLGRFPFWRGQMGLLDALEPAYESASQAGLKLFLGEIPDS